jgi:hypothetical protein
LQLSNRIGAIARGDRGESYGHVDEEGTGQNRRQAEAGTRRRRSGKEEASRQEGLISEADAASARACAASAPPVSPPATNIAGQSCAPSCVPDIFPAVPSAARNMRAVL